MNSFDCLNASVTYILQEQGWKLNGYDIFLTGGGYNIWHQNNILQLYSNSYSANFTFLADNNVLYKHCFFNEKEISELFLINIIKDYFVLLKVNTSILKYENFYRGIEATEHYILLENIEKDYFNILDIFVPSNNPHLCKGIVKRQKCMESWRDYQFETILLKKKIEKQTTIFNPKSEECFYRGCLRYLRNDIDPYIKEKLDITKKFSFGHNAIIKMIDDYINLVNEKCECPFTVTKKFVFQIRWGGYLGYLKYLSSYFRDNHKMGKWADEWIKLIQQWEMHLLLLLRLAMKKEVVKITQLGQDMKSDIYKESHILSDILCEGDFIV